MSGWSQFAEQHWIVGGMLASLLWFLAGRQSLGNRQPRYALLWQGIAVFIVGILCVWAVLEREWRGVEPIQGSTWGQIRASSTPCE